MWRGPAVAACRRSRPQDRIEGLSEAVIFVESKDGGERPAEEQVEERAER
jgi:hypothetical protein